MYDKILVAVDQSPVSDRAVLAARDLPSCLRVKCGCCTMYGHAAREIVADAIELDCGIIVMGSRGRGDLAGLVIGSTAHKVIHLTGRPVLIVR